jgi:hypothetical protein
MFMFCGLDTEFVTNLWDDKWIEKDAEGSGRGLI